MSKVVCNYWRCGWCGEDSEALKSPHPFSDGEELLFCPRCRDITLVAACDEPGCKAQATCGWPTETGYRQTCGTHRQKGTRVSERSSLAER